MYLKSRNCLQELHQRHTMCIGKPRSRQNSLQKGDSEAHHSDTSTADHHVEDTQFRVLYNNAPKTLSLIHTDIVFDRVIYWQSFIVCYNSVFIRERYFLNFCAVKTFENRINLIVLIANDCKLKYSKTTFCYDFYTTYTGISNSQLM